MSCRRWRRSWAQLRPATAVGHALQQALAPATARPRVVALFVLDGARADYFDTYAEAMPTLSRLRREGMWFTNAHVTSVPTLTAVGHANLGTGAEPRTHGLAVNNLFNRVTGKPQEAYNELDPRELMALTLADVWNIETDGQAIIIGQGGAIRAVAGLVGHGACIVNGRRVLAASYSTRDAGWETNPACYTLPDALKSHQRADVLGAGGRHVDGLTTSRTRSSSAIRPCFNASKATRSPQCSSSKTSAQTT